MQPPQSSPSSLLIPRSVGPVGWAWRFGVALPLLYYVGRRWFWTLFCWDLPVHSLAREGAALGVCLAAAGAVLAIERRRGNSIASTSTMRPRAIGVVAIVCLAAWLLFRFHFTWITVELNQPFTPGDGNAWVRDSSRPEFVGSEPLGRLSHYFAYRALALFGAADSPNAVRLSSAVAGAVWLAALFAFAPAVFRGMRPWLAVLLLFIAPSTLFFAGYPETTPWSRALAGVYWLAGLRYLAMRPARPPWIETLIFMFAAGAHGMVCFAYGSQLILIALWKKRTPGASVFVALALAALPFAALGAGMLGAHRDLDGNVWYGNALKGGHFLIYFFTPGNVSRYRFLERRYIIDVVNLWLAVCPMLPLAFMGLRDLWKTRCDEALFLGAGLAGTIVLALFWNADFGMEADVDLLGFFAVPAMIAIALWWSERLAPAVQTRVVLAVAATAWLCSLLPFLQWE